MADGSTYNRASDAKRSAIVSAAAKVFLSEGYGAATMDQIARTAGVSKQTVYSHFGSKDALFEEIIRAKCAELVGQDEDWSLSGDDPREVLVAVATRYQKVVLAENSIKLFRVIVAECERFPELADRFHRAGPAAATQRLSRFLDAQELCAGPAKATRAAECFFAMLRDDLYIRRLLAMCAAPTEAEARDRAEHLVTAFLVMLAHEPSDGAAHPAM